MTTRHDHLTRFIRLDHRLDSITRSLTGGLGQFSTAEAVRRDKGGYQFRDQSRLFLGQCQADQRRHAAANGCHVILADGVAHDLLEHAQGLLLDSIPAGIGQVQDLAGGFGVERQVAQGLDVRLFLLGRGKFVGTHQADIVESSPQAFDLTARGGRIGR